MLDWLKRLFRTQPQRRPRRPAGPVLLRGARPAIQASYDAAQTTDENRKHWANADALSASGALSVTIRKTIRERARYETANNCYAKGLTLTLANHLVGERGPGLQVLTPDTALNQAIEQRWAEWSHEVRLADSLRVLKQTKTVDGEAFARLATNDALPTSVKLDLQLLEGDQVTDPWLVSFDSGYDGIVYDDYGNPALYRVLRYHPGDALRGFSIDYDEVPARRMIHWYRQDRPGQVRGVSELTPALALFAQLRRFTLATLTAAETAAMFAAIVKTTGAGNTEDGDAPEYWSTQEIVRGMMTALPDGYDMQQFAAEHPNSTHEQFVSVLLREIGRCLNVPYHIVAGDYANSNYSTARLGSQDFRLSMRVERQDCEREVLDPLFREWFEEASLIPMLLPPGAQAYLAGLPHTWHWPTWEYIDPMTEAQAAEKRLQVGISTKADECGEQGQDWKAVIRQRVIEEQYEAQVRREMGMEAPAAAKPRVAVAPAQVLSNTQR